MSDILHGYILSLICMAFVCYVALILTPQGRVRRAVCFACAVSMLCVMVRPALLPDIDTLSSSVAKYRELAEKYSGEGEENTEKLNRLYIQERCAAYILDKAESLGLRPGEIRVGLRWSDGGYWYPVSAELEEDYNGRLSAFMEAELGISADMQKWRDK